MGSTNSLLKILNCEMCAKYVCNAMLIKSDCCDCWHFEYITDKIEIQKEESDEEIICDSCCSVKHKH
jgi:hypothetical protein